MQNENAGKTVEQIAEEHAMNHSDSSQHETAKYSFIDGYTTAHQSQPMWMEIEDSKLYYDAIVKNDKGEIFHYQRCRGALYIDLGYTHYLSSEDLLRLPIAQSK